MMKIFTLKSLLLLFLACWLVSCRNGHSSAVQLSRKIDSVKALDEAHRLRLHGIHLDDASPLKIFYDSLCVQPLPLSFTDDHVHGLPGFTVVPAEIKEFLNLEGRMMPKAVSLPETLGARLMLLAADLEDGDYALWLYSLDDEFYPVDKLLLYDPRQASTAKAGADRKNVYFFITSDYVIHVVRHTDSSDSEGQFREYFIGDGRQFIESIQ
jgi:hypothetical protein